MARRYVVSGRVQGVGFRFFTEEVARREGLSGHVRNLDDGRVETVVAGEMSAVERFERAISMGPPLARVDDVTIETRLPDPSDQGFRVRA